MGLFTIGGGYAMLPIIQEAVCTEKGWLTDEEFLDSISLTNSLPGPLATNCATFIGYRLKRVPGSIAAILGTICPSIIIILLIAMVFNTAMDNAYVQAFFRGVGPAVFALIVRRLPSSRLWRRLVLKDASTSRRGFVSAPPRESRVGKRGVVSTELRPAGTALIDGRPVDVVSEGAFLPKGTAVRVIAVEGMRVVVRREEETETR